MLATIDPVYLIPIFTVIFILFLFGYYLGSEKPCSYRPEPVERRRPPVSPPSPVVWVVSNNKKEEEDCPVCMDQSRDTVLIHCGHVLCHVCAARLEGYSMKCPVCRGFIMGVLRIRW